MIVFHPEVHISYFEAQKQVLKSQAIQNEIILLLECKEYKSSCTENINGMENLGIYPDTVLCTTYTMAQVPFKTLKEGGHHSIAILVLFLCCIQFFPEMKEYMMQFKDEIWFPSYEHFLQEIHFDVREYENVNENMKQHIRNQAKLYGGLPSNIPYKCIHESCLYMLQYRYPNEKIDNVVIEKTLLQREKSMSENIIDAIKNNHTNKPIHICIGAGHLMPFLNEKQISVLGLDTFFIDYHTNIKHPRLLYYLHQHGIHYDIVL
jgi:hypothetical protein